MIKSLYEDSDILVVIKPAGMESQTARRLEPDMVSEIKNHLRLSTKISTKTSPKTEKDSGEPYVGVIHRLDKPVSGVMVYAKTKRAAQSLSRQVQNGRTEKEYRAVLCGKPVDIVGNYVDYLLKDGKENKSSVVEKTVENSRRAELSYRVLEIREAGQGIFGGSDAGQGDAPFPLALVEIHLKTGRHHQIRVQFAAHGTPLWGDAKYNPIWVDMRGARSGLALCAVRLSFDHPVSGKRMSFSMKPEGGAFDYFASRKGV